MTASQTTSTAASLAQPGPSGPSGRAGGVSNPNVTVTPAAEKFMRRMVRFSAYPAGGFRLSVAPGGCSGLSAEFSVEPGPRAGDAVLGVNGLAVYLPAESRLLLDGVTMDFTDTPLQSGLTFVDPKQGACGCSTAGEASAPAQAAVALDTIKRVVRA